MLLLLFFAVNVLLRSSPHLVVDAFPNQAGNCPKGFAATRGGGSPHTDQSKKINTGRLRRGGFFVKALGKRIVDGGTIRLPADGLPKRLVLVAEGDKNFKGFLFRLPGSNNVILDLAPNENKAGISSSCLAANAQGIEHVGPANKKSVALRVRASREAVMYMDVTVVDFNTAKRSAFYHSRYRVEFFKSASPLPGPSPSPPTGPPPTGFPTSSNPNVKLELIAKNLVAPLLALADPLPGGERVFIVEKLGQVKIVNAQGQVESQPFLDMSGYISDDNEGGLLSLAFHPDYATNGYFFINYTMRPKKDPGSLWTIIRRLKVSGNPNIATPPSVFAEERVLVFKQTASNHNGGMMFFGPKDGYLYISSGDGGPGKDPNNNAQRMNTVLGKILRINVTVDNPSQAGYTIPDENPFKASSTRRREILYLGLRNPWRFSADRQSGALTIGDVGQNEFEEVNFVPYSKLNTPWNFGWRRQEAKKCFIPATKCRSGVPNLRDPKIVYRSGGANDIGCSVTGGYVYRGSAIPSMFDKYIFADYCGATGSIGSPIYMATKSTDGGPWAFERIFQTNNMRVGSFGEDKNGELYVVNLTDRKTGLGAVYKIVQA